MRFDIVLNFVLLLRTFLLARLHHGNFLIARSCALFERIRGRPYCLHGGHGLFNITQFGKLEARHYNLGFECHVIPEQREYLG